MERDYTAALILREVELDYVKDVMAVEVTKSAKVRRRWVGVTAALLGVLGTTVGLLLTEDNRD